MIPKATVIRLDRKTRGELEGWLRASTTEQRKDNDAQRVFCLNVRIDAAESANASLH